MKERHAAVIEKLNAVLSERLRQEWLAMISEWENDKLKPNPYTHVEKGYYLLLRCLRSVVPMST